MFLWMVLVTTAVNVHGYGYYGRNNGPTGQEPVEDAFFDKPQGQKPVEDYFHKKEHHYGKQKDKFFHNDHGSFFNGQEPVEDVFNHQQNGQEPVEDAFFDKSHGQEPVEDAFKHQPHGQEPVEDAFKHQQHGQEPVEDAFFDNPHGQEPVEDAFKHQPHGQEPVEEAFKYQQHGQVPVEDAFFGKSHGQEPVEDAFKHQQHGQEPVEDAFFNKPHGQEPVEDVFKHQQLGQEPVEDAFFGKPHGQEPVEDVFKHQPYWQEPVEDAFKHQQHGPVPVEDAFFGKSHGQEPIEDAFKHQPHGQEPVEDALFDKPHGQEPVEDVFKHQLHGQETVEDAFDGKLHGQEPVEDAFKHQPHGQEPVEDAFGHQQHGQEPVEDIQADSSYRKSYGYGFGERQYGYESHGKYSGYGGYGHHISGGCSAKLMAPMNSQLVCHDKKDCIATCMSGHTFPNGVSKLSIICEKGNWKVKDYSDNTIPSCSPLCLPMCQNNGICIQPNQCSCSENFYGPYCQYERKPCLDKPALPQNSKMSCFNHQDCDINCMSGHQFSDGSTQTQIKCKEGEWIPVRKDWTYIPDCEPICSPPCENGGNCLSYNKCQCPQEFRGPQCQYSTSSCDVRSLGFNGNYKCSGDHESLKCTLTCPEGMSFQSPSSPVYTCKYEFGVFEPTLVPRCIFDSNRDDVLLNYIFPEINESSLYHTEYLHNKTEHILIIPKKESLIWSCFTWHGDHFRTFDGKIKSFTNDCSKKMIDGDIEFQSLKIDTPALGSCQDCSNLLVNFDIHNFNFSVDSSKKLTIHDGNTTYHAPKKIDKLKIELGSNSMTLRMGSKLTIKWNFENFIDIKIEKSALKLSNGICGVVNQESGTKLLKNDEGICKENQKDNICVNKMTEDKAEEFCKKMVENTIFEDCRKVVNVKEFYDACKWDYCACEMAHKENHNCGCQSISMFVKECKEQDVKIESWREIDFCPMTCSNGKVYKVCGKDNICGGVETEGDACEEGCFCPEGTYSYNNTCIEKNHCPCKLRGRTFPPGKELPKDCNTCTCANGSWVCTKLKCSARCEAVGDPHYLTFDKMNYEFMGKCSYIMLQNDNYTIETENTPCDGAISQTLGYSTYLYKDEPSCTKSVTIKIGDTEIKLKQGKQISVNGIDHKIPVTIQNAHVRKASSIFIQVTLNDGVEVMWDGKTRVYIQAPPNLKGKTKGLCGTFNGLRSDDFLTPEGDIEQDPVSFGNKWKTKESCPTMNITSYNPCSDSKMHSLALKICDIINQPIFKECELEDNEKEIYYKFCMYDVCSCNHRPSECYCPIISAYADRCSKGGHRIDWRPKIRECGLRCPREQIYEVCGNSCSRSCLDISRETSCGSCLEGCYCPPGYTMDHKEKCIPISDCPCIRKGLDYPPGHKEIQPDPKGPQLCTCTNALWDCKKASNEEIIIYKNKTMENIVCSSTKHQVYTHCEPSVPITCQNMHSYKRDQSEAVCYGGCVCKKGYVLDSVTNECVKPDQCSCHHGGQSFKDGDIINEKCNTCKCKHGKWTCTEHQCPGICTTWGDSHFKTFDNHIYDFQGACEYVLVKGALSPDPDDCFSIIVELVPCGSSGVSCSKSVSLNVGSGVAKETIVFSDHKASITSNLTKISYRESGLYLFAEVYEMGIVLQWDKGTIISIKMDPKWKGRTKGLCGNYNDIYSDDFQTPSGGEETSVEMFGDAWKIYDYCPNEEQIKDTCTIHPNRKSWALEQCSILKSQIFKRCHSEVPVDEYFERCVFDTCGCDQGGDCNCLCTAISAYAQECNIHGVPIKWRSQELCPMQCDETCSEYSPCIPTCTQETCDDIMNYKKNNNLCKQDSCIEGCQFKECPKGEIYRNSSRKECVPKTDCVPVCLVLDDKTYYEGDLIESDDCHRCFCTLNKKSCLGEPCKDVSTTEMPLPRDEMMTCISGWSEWINNHNVENDSEIELLPLPKDFKEKNSPRCDKSKMAGINCRTVDSHLSQKATGENAVCSIETDGLICKDGCHDYEIQVLCQCEQPTTPFTVIHEYDCDITHPYKIDEWNCAHYYKCEETLDGIKYVDKYCDEGYLFSNETFTCELSTFVSKYRPNCQEKFQLLRTTEPTNDENLNGCASDEVWDDCAYKCDQLCHYAESVLFKQRCEIGLNCLSGCRPKITCSSHKRWRDMKTCVDFEDCTCASLTNEMIKPGEVIKGNCTTCQCLKNEYKCHEIDCHPTTTTAPTTFTDVVIIPSTISPPPPCEKNRVKPLLRDIPDSAITASSSHFNSQPYYGRINNTDTSWAPEFDDVTQYIQIDLGKIEAIYGVVILGDPKKIEYVTSFYVVYSIDGIAYSYVTYANKPEVFKGPNTNLEKTQRLFTIPIEARYVRINPISWINKPALRIEILGCGDSYTTAFEPTTEKLPICTDEMSHLMDDRQVKASSSTKKVTASLISINREDYWVPLTSDAHQWIEFDFLGERTITGLLIGGSGTQSDLFWPTSWVSSFTVSYSHDGQIWNPVIKKDGTLQIFNGNVDPVTIKKVIFWDPVSTRFVRIYPIKWHKEISMRVEILGCYEPYKILPPIIIEENLSIKDCNFCPGVSSSSGTCPCLKSSEWWDGEQCTSRSRCPCFVGFISYAIGAVFDNENCEQCVCALNGITECKPKKCPPCDNGLKQARSDQCVCECKPCPIGERLCPTSNICIKVSSWCNGIIECPDDEIDCTTTTPRIETSTCAPVECPPGFTVKISKQKEETQWSPFGTKSKWGSYFKGRTTYGNGMFKGFKTHKTYGYSKETKSIKKETSKLECPQYECIPEKNTKHEICPKPNCAPNYDLNEIKNENNNCPQYTCIPQKIKIPDGKCNITGRTFTTFDGMEYKYDVCDHTIANNVENDWSIKKLKNCNGLQIPPCLEIKQGKDKIMITKDFNTYYNGFVYTIAQLQKIGTQSAQFSIQKASDKFIIFISDREFSVIWDSQGNIKVTVSGESQGKVDGMCGYFDGNVENDKLTPNKTIAKTSVEFGDSWGENIGCEVISCPLHIQKEAFEKCQAFKEEPLSKCAAVINMDKLMSQCVESMCACVQQGNKSETCRCQSVLDTVTECQSRLPGVDLSRWRMNYDCPVECPSGMVYKECFNRICEPCCAELMLEDACPETEECFPGCYCPDGYVRNMDRCVKPSECRDCQCDGYGNSRFVTFDRMDFTLNGKCTHTLAQTLEGPNGFKALITHKPCEKNTHCLYMITIIYKENIIQLINDDNKYVTVKINNELIKKRPFKNDWISVIESQGKCVTISIQKIQLDLEFFNGGKGFNLRLPSHLYNGRTEGLCGSCNMNGTDDFKLRNGQLSENISEFGDNWLVKDLPEAIEKLDSCEAVEIQRCEPPPSDNDPCQKLMDENLFGHCFAVLDPAVYVEKCHEDLCHNGNICDILESYARECQNEGVCLKWRSRDLCPYNCPSNLEYKPCGIGCTETCDNYEIYRSNPDACTATKGDSCQCPTGKVLRNDTCMDEKYCTPCDTEGHFPGDKWQPDTCTECSCEKGTIQCQRIQCTNSGTVCSRGFKSVISSGTENQCCPAYICVPEPMESECPEPVQPKCGLGQIMKLSSSKSGCQEFICECKPKDECEDVTEEMNKKRIPGMIPILDKSGCCPVVIEKCNITICPEPDPCPEHHIHIKRDTELCCPDFKCVIPEDKCLYEMNYITSEKGGGERERNVLEKYSVLKTVRESWNDGPCRTCECKEGSNKAICTVISCSPPPESDNYVLKPKYVNGKCCPIYERTACKMGFDIYQVGQVWPSFDKNPCINMTCEIGKDMVINKQEIVENCKKDCKDGWKYYESLTQCCGECKPEGCLVNGKLHHKDAVWFSEDNCTAYQCTITDDQVHVAISEEKCPNIENCPEERIYQDICCKKCNETIPESYSSCAKEPIDPKDTIGIVVYHDKIHGKCVNKDVIKGFTECKGSCDSHTSFNTVSLKYESKCLCCKPDNVHTVDVPLDCEDHHTMTFHLHLPNYCKCIPCEKNEILEF